MSKTSHVGTHSPDSVAPPSANPTSSAPAAASREEEPPLSGILDPVELINQIRQLPPSEWPHGVPQEVQAKMLKPHPPKAWIFEIDIRTDTGLHSLIGKVYATDRPDIYQITEKLRQAGLGPGADFAVPQPVAYVAPLRLLLQERVEGTPGKKVFKYSNDSERGLAAERCARWLARFHAVAAPAGPVADAQKYLDDAGRKCRLISAADRSFASRCEHLLERLRAAAPSPAKEGPCMSANVRGENSASRRIVAPMPGFRLENLKRSSAAIAGPTTSASVNAGPSPSWVNRSPHSRVPVVSSQRTPASQPCGICGVSR